MFSAALWPTVDMVSEKAATVDVTGKLLSGLLLFVMFHRQDARPWSASPSPIVGRTNSFTAAGYIRQFYQNSQVFRVALKGSIGIL